MREVEGMVEVAKDWPEGVVLGEGLAGAGTLCEGNV